MKSYKIIIGFMMLFCCIYSCKEQGNQKVQKGTYKSTVKDSITNADPNTLKSYYEKAHGTQDTLKFRRLFFLMFPNNFNSFNSMYGYNDGKGEMPLYNFYEKHISFFCRLVSEQADAEGYNKLIRLGIGGHWDADPINLLQECIVQHVNRNPSLALMQLKQFNDKEIKSFWKFFYDGPHPSDIQIKKRYNSLYVKMKVLDTAIANLMKNEYERLVKEFETHGQ